jgi:CBS domain-containing protein
MLQLDEVPISRLAPLPHLVASSDETVLNCVRRMREARHGCVVVVKDEIPIGVITERDVLRRMGASLSLEVPVMEACSSQIWAVRTSDSVADALREMTRRQCRHLIVVNDEGKFAGILSVRRIVHELVEHFPSAVYNLPPDAKQAQTDREGA